jgi:segregation and condensation protein B
LGNSDADEIRKLLKALQADYEKSDRGMMIREIAGGYQMLSNSQYAEYVRNFFKTRVKEKLSRPALEALAIAAYRQPVSRADIEVIRGVNSDGVVTNLLEKGLIKIVGRKDVPGRPFLYGTAKAFLEYFGLKSLKDLPKLEDVSELLRAGEGDAAEGTRGSGLFDSNKAVSVEDAVMDFGGDDHITQSFAREHTVEAFEEEFEGDDGTRAESDSDDNEQDASPDEPGNEEEEAVVDPVEPADDLKKVMDEMGRECSDDEVLEKTSEEIVKE